MQLEQDHLGQFGIEIIRGSDLHETEPNGISSTTGEEIPPTILILEDNNSSDEQPQVTPAVPSQSEETEFETTYREFADMPTFPVPDHLPVSLQKYFTQIIDGDTSAELSDAQLKDVVKGYLPPAPLIQISPERQMEIVDHTSQVLTYMAPHNKWSVLANPDTRLMMLDGKVGVYIGNQRTGEGSPLTAEDRKRILTNPDLYLGIPYETDRVKSTGIKMMGTRSIDAYGRGSSTLDLIDGIANSSEPHKRILDIGGSTGLAARGIERLHSNIDVTNLTTVPDPGVYPLRGGHVLGVAEQMSNRDFERYQGIISNYAFDYMHSPHLALCSSLLALKPNGVMDLDYNYGSYIIEDAALQKLSQESLPVFDRLQLLAQKGAITFSPGHRTSTVNIDGAIIPYGRVSIQKNTSIDPEDVIKFDQFEF